GEEGWSSWKHTPEVVILPTGNDVWEFEIEDRSDAGEYRSLFHVRNYMQTEQVAPLVALFSRYPMPRKIWKTRGEHWWDVGTDAPERVYVEMIGGGAAGGAGWISRGSHWDGASGKLIPFQIRLQAGGGG